LSQITISAGATATIPTGTALTVGPPASTNGVYLHNGTSYVQCAELN
jgi:hypothetical protein